MYTFGFGSDHDASLLEAISTQGGGVYYYIDSSEKVCVTMEYERLTVQGSGSRKRSVQESPG